MICDISWSLTTLLLLNDYAGLRVPLCWRHKQLTICYWWLLHMQVPGNIRRAEHFVSFLRRLLEFMRTCLSVQNVEQQSPQTFLDRLQAQVAIDGKFQILNTQDFPFLSFPFHNVEISLIVKLHTVMYWSESTKKVADWENRSHACANCW